MRVVTLAVAIFAATLGGVDAVAASPFSGIPEIIDGDTVQFDATKFRLDGIDAPQMDQRCFDKTGADWNCGIDARQHLVTLAAGRSWACTTVRKNVYGRQFVKCRSGDGDIARQMVRDGWAIASTTGIATYIPDENIARAERAGLWAGSFVSPLDWRQHNWHAKVLGRVVLDEKSSSRLLTSAFGPNPPTPDCAIKGNINWSGQCIFHKPGGRWYKRITMEARYGDRWFCSPIEAISAGCRETRR